MAEASEKNTRWVIIALVLIGLVVAWVFSQATKTLFVKMRIIDYQILGETFTLASLIGLTFSATIGVVLWNRDNFNDMAHEVVSELKKVTWPTRKETQTNTIVTIITTVIVATILWIFDMFWSWATSSIYG